MFRSFLAVFLLACCATAQTHSDDWIDVVATDKSDQPVHGLSADDFRVQQEGHEQSVREVSEVRNAPSYIVLLFNTLHITPEQEGAIRRATKDFALSAGSEGRRVAVVTLDRDSLNTRLGFSSDPLAIQHALESLKLADPIATDARNVHDALNKNVDRATGIVDRSANQLLSSLAGLAENISTLPGRKAVVVFSKDFAIDTDLQSRMISVANACNRSEVAVYPAVPGSQNSGMLDQLAARTGGLTLWHYEKKNSGLARVAAEEADYYRLRIEPEHADPGQCYSLKVKSKQGGIDVRSGTTNCLRESDQALAGTTAAAKLKAIMAGPLSSTQFTASLTAPYFYIGEDRVRVDVTMDVLPTAGAYDIMGAAYADSDGHIAAEFSEHVQPGQNLTADGFSRFQKMIDLRIGKYRLDLALSTAGGSTAKLETVLNIDPLQAGTPMLSSIVLTRDLAPLTPEARSRIMGELVPDLRPLTSVGFAISPTPRAIFDRAGNAAMYVEVYDPLLKPQFLAPQLELRTRPPDLLLDVKIVSALNSQTVFESGSMNMNDYETRDNYIVPIVLKLPINQFPAGEYRIEAQAQDSSGAKSPVRTAEFVSQ